MRSSICLAKKVRNHDMQALTRFRALRSGVECVDGGTPALDAFGTMLARGVSAMGVLNEEGRLVANLSPSDLRAVLPDHFGVLALPVHRLLELQAGGGFGGYASRAGTAGARARSRGVICVKADATLADAMKAIVGHGLHHVFVVDDQQAPLAVVSTTDVLRLLVSP
jgi:CBS domain-containing protein